MQGESKLKTTARYHQHTPVDGQQRIDGRSPGLMTQTAVKKPSQADAQWLTTFLSPRHVQLRGQLRLPTKITVGLNSHFHPIKEPSITRESLQLFFDKNNMRNTHHHTAFRPMIPNRPEINKIALPGRGTLAAVTASNPCPGCVIQ